MFVYNKIRKSSATIDLCDLYDVIEVEGDDNIQLLDSIFPKEMSLIRNYFGRFVPLLDENAKVVTMPLALRLDDKIILLVPSKTTEIFKSFINSISNSRDTHIATHKTDVVLFSIEGLTGWKEIEKIFNEDLRGIGIGSVVEFTIDRIKACVIRASLFGGVGFICVLEGKHDDLYSFIKSKIGNDEFIKGKGIEDKLLLLSREVGSMLWDGCISRGDCPFENNLIHLLDIDRKEYKFANTLFQARDMVKNRILGISIEGDRVSQDMQKNGLLYAGTQVGKIKTLNFSPALNRIIGYAIVQESLSYPGVVFTTDRGAEVRSCMLPFVETQVLAI